MFGSAMPNEPLPSVPPAAANNETLEPAKAADTGTPAPAKSPVPTVAVSRRGSLVGETFGDFEVVAEIGRGGMGVVYKARQKSLDRMVALKMLPAEYFEDPVRLARFQAEARIAAGLGHPHIVQIYQVGECPAGQFFAMEFVEGETLESLVTKGPLPIPAAVVWMVRVAEAVHYAHTKGIIHRDLKPANIMIDKFRRPIVMDFGIAKFLQATSSLTEQGIIVGTPAYMAPEQTGETPWEIGPHSDVYSLGAILYTMLTGRQPYDEGTALRTLMKVLSPEMPPPVRRWRPEIPEELERICMKCLNKRPADRYASAQALADALRRCRTTPAPAAKPAPALPDVVLIMAGTGKEIRLTRPRIVIGRGKECNLILKAADVSKTHCQIRIEPDQVIVEDLASANGTFVNAERVQQARLEDGDQLTIGDHCTFLVQINKPTP